MSGPLWVEVRRGGVVESRHRVDAVVVDASGSLMAGWGDVDRPVLPRSAAKPIQMLPLVTTGAADAFGLEPRHLAIACASHRGESEHVALVGEWLNRLGAGPEALACGSHPPFHRPAADTLVADGRAPDERHNNCSGKHCGFLTIASHMGLDTAGYLAADHPLQRDHVSPALAERCDVDLTGQVAGVDGCGIPVWTVPLVSLARGWATLPAEASGARLLDAMTAHPFLVSGTDGACTRLMELGEGRVVAKTGAEGVYCAIDRLRGHAVALKAADGASRASEAAVAWVLGELGAMARPGPDVLRNWVGSPVGDVRVSPTAPGPGDG